jgi:drug/metabolite transporter (DMT)-like permease
LLTSICWSFTSIFFTLSGRIVGSPIVNRTRLIFGLGIVTVVHWIAFGQPMPFDASLSRWGWMALSGVIGFVIGDAFLFQAFVMIGPRLSMLVMALSPVMSAVLAWLLLDESLSAIQIVGIALAVGGVAWVVSDRTNGHSLPDPSRRAYLLGLLWAFGGALGQTGGYLASKQGLEGDFPALSGNLIRLVAATALIWTYTAFNGQVRQGIDTLGQNPRAVRLILGGAIFGPFIGVWLSLVSVQNAPVGVASTLTSLMPIFLLPLGYIVFKEPIKQRAVVGTVLAVIGTAVLFLAI